MNSPSSPSIKSFYIENLGCAKNQVDAEEMIRALELKGLSFTASSEEADVIIVNSCGFIGPAKEESLNVLFDFRRAYPGKKIILAGCLSQRYGETMDLPEADAVFGNRNPSQIISVIDAVERGERPVFIPDACFHPEGRTRFLNFKGSCYLKIAEGCNNNCSYCAIPLIRGPVQSRTIDEITREFRMLRETGAFEINLIAQDLASFGIDRTPGGELIPLLKALTKTPGDYWLRLLYIHPDRFPPDLINIIGDDPRILPYFDLPFQHASPDILSSMGRKPDPGANLELIGNIRNAFDTGVIRSTFLLGYPGETESDVEALIRFQKQARFDWLGAFVYSREEGTRAYKLRGSAARKFAEKKAEKHKTAVENIQIPITEERLDRFVGKEMKLLIEERVEGEDLYICRGFAHAPDVDGAVVLHAAGLGEGDVAVSRIIRRNGFDLEAVLV